MADTTIVVLIGASGSGSALIAAELGRLGYNTIQKFTTRKQQGLHDCGCKYIKGEASSSKQYLMTGTKTICVDEAIMCYQGYGDDGYYFVLEDQVIAGEINIVATNVEGSEQVKSFYSGTDIKIITIYLQVDEQIRAERLVRRVNLGYTFTPKDNPKVWSVIRPDRKIFRIVKADYTVNANSRIDKVVNLVQDIIGGDKNG